MIKLIKNEFRKSFIKENFLPTIILISAICLIFILNDFDKKTINTIYYLIPFIGIIISISASNIVSNEYRFGTFKSYLTKPVKRWKIIISKFLYLIILSIFYIVLTLIFYIILFLFSNKINNLNEIIINYFIYSVPILFMISFSIFLSTIINKNNFALAISILTITCSTLLSQALFGLKINFIEYTFLPYLDFSIFLDISNIKLMNIELGLHLSIINGIIILLFYTLFFIISSIIIFNKKDITN